MSKKCVLVLVFFGGTILPARTQVTEIISVVKSVITKVIQAADLEVQKIQTETIWLQNAQKVLENTMTELKLQDIADWVQKQRGLYQEYYNELWQVKQVITDYERLKSLIHMQQEIVAVCNKVNGLFAKDSHFSTDEINYMSAVYAGILGQSLKTLDQVMLVANSYMTQMSDAQRMKLIAQAESTMESIYSDLKSFNNQNIQLGIQRGLDRNDLETIRRLYSIP